MKTVIKLAGALLEDEALVRAIAGQIAALAQSGQQILVVHGGGRLFTATLKRMGIESNFVAGLRVTDRETRDVVAVDISEDTEASLILLFDPGHALDERILREQFNV